MLDNQIASSLWRKNYERSYKQQEFAYNDIYSC